ncbi:MAG TPA: pseudouridine synthase [Solirubrobacteraceae bacterium]|nr:pseudouridine synthase [Solirubrobacteraceae bacterium]
MRLAKLLALAGVASRRASERLVREGRVAVDGRTVTDPALDVEEFARVSVNGAPLREPGPRVVYALNKPPGVVSTARDPQRRTTVVSLVDSPLRLYPVGRLDVDVTGLILLTNDGELAHSLTHPRFRVPRTYRAVVGGGPVSEAALRALRAGVELDDGRTAPARARRLADDTIQLTIHEGRKRQVKRMCAAVGHPVRRLERVAFGPLALGGLAPGQSRRLSEAEVAALRALAAAAAPAPAGAAAPAPATAAAPASATAAAPEPAARRATGSVPRS